MNSNVNTAGIVLGSQLGKILGHYFVAYPIMYFSYNYIITTLGFPQYVIPGFWFGMLCFLFLTAFRNIFFKR